MAIKTFTAPRVTYGNGIRLYILNNLSVILCWPILLPYSFEKPGQNNYGLGFRLKLLPNLKKVIYHFGRWPGNNSAFARLTEEQVTVIILGNRFNHQIYTIVSKSYSLFGPNGAYNQREED